MEPVDKYELEPFVQYHTECILVPQSDLGYYVPLPLHDLSVEVEWCTLRVRRHR